ncbi:unnamed protein product [Cylindrotheca closterium]|uniref:Uncharacterized protein n=1 Tax=Cylindrotheca closterium TaxID=2856 RepID=A0AAD2CCH8_9STRA|nr:unnamed protein product [Cylindrotheca closterium]
MPTLLSTAMCASFKSNGDSETTASSSPPTKRNFFVRSSSQSSSGSRSTTSTSSTSTVSSYRGSKVAMGDLSKVRNGDDDFCNHNNNGLDMENWKSFHRRFGTKPNKPKPSRRVSATSAGAALLRSANNRRKASRKDSKQEANNETDPSLWKSMIHAAKGCTSPMWEHASAPIGDDEWSNEVPSHQRLGLLDIRQENGRWYFLEDASVATDAVEYQLTE